MLRFTRQLPHPAEKVWQAITELEHLEAWFPHRIVGEWHECLDLLEHDLDGSSPACGWGDRWAEVHPGSVEQFGPEAATIGPTGEQQRR